MQLKNQAAWIPAAKHQLVVSAAPFPPCGPKDIVLRNYAVAINPVDWKIQASDIFNLKYPYILGEDVAGEIIEVGSKASKHFKVGQRVTGFALGLGANDPARGGFQLYPLLNPVTCCVIPDDMDYEAAAVLPLSISTATAGLYLKSGLGLPWPKVSSKDHRFRTHELPHSPSLSLSSSTTEMPMTTTTKTLLLWGGSSSVGSSVIQLAVASGLKVITTASPSNYEYCKSLGAALVLDYHNPDIITILVALLSQTKCLGAYDAIGAEATVKQCAKILDKLSDVVKKVVSVGATPKPDEKDVEVAGISSTSIVKDEPELAKFMWGDFLPEALKTGVVKARPKELIVGEGLEEVQGALDRQKEGVSARKVVVKL